MSNKYVQRAQRHVTASKDTADDAKSMAKDFLNVINDPAFYNLPQDLIFQTIENFTGELTEEQITKMDEAIKKNHGHRAQKKFRTLETITQSLQNIAEGKAAQATPVAEEEDGDEAVGEEEEFAGEEEDFVDEGIADEDVPEGLLRSIWTGDFKQVQHYIHKNSKMEEQFDRVGYPLHCAVFQDRTEIVQYLLKKGAKVNQPGALGQTPLHFACQGDVAEIFDMLMKTKGIDVNAKDDEGDTPLIVAARNGKVNYIKQLVAKGAKIDQQNNSNSTALHEAAKACKYDAAVALVELNANMNLMDGNFKTPFMVACESGASDIASMLQNKFSQSNQILIEPYSDDDD